jgi:hypothetical protein
MCLISSPGSSRRSIAIGWRAFASLGLIGVATLHTSVALAEQTAEERECPIKTNTAKLGTPLKPPVELAPTQQSAQKVVNFDTGRNFKVMKHLTVTASKPLPPSLESGQLNFDAVLSRTGNTLESAEFPDPTFSHAYIAQDRRSISFAVCLNPAGISAGKYVGFVTVSGPEGLGSASIGLTTNAKDGVLFYVSAFAAVVAAFILLVLKDAAAIKQDLTWKQTFGLPLHEPLWWAATVIAVFSTFGSVYTIYTNDPAWGATGFASLVALVGAATAAVGGHTILTTLGSRIRR